MFHIPVQLTTRVKGQHPVPLRENAHIAQESAELGTVMAVLMHICREEERFGAAAATCNTCVYTVPKSVIWACVVYQTLYRGVSDDRGKYEVG
jgi:hypothetical protein